MLVNCFDRWLTYVSWASIDPLQATLIVNVWPNLQLYYYYTIFAVNVRLYELYQYTIFSGYSTNAHICGFLYVDNLKVYRGGINWPWNIEAQWNFLWSLNWKSLYLHLKRSYDAFIKHNTFYYLLYLYMLMTALVRQWEVLNQEWNWSKVLMTFHYNAWTSVQSWTCII